MIQISNFLKVSGSTLISVILERNRFLTVINIGDSRAVACDITGNAVPLSIDHKPSDVRFFVFSSVLPVVFYFNLKISIKNYKYLT